MRQQNEEQKAVYRSSTTKCSLTTMLLSSMRYSSAITLRNSMLLRPLGLCVLGVVKW